MVSTSWFFILIFAVPLIVFLIWLMKQDKRKAVWGIVIVVVLAIAAIIASSRASKNAVEDFELRKKESLEKSDP